MEIIRLATDQDIDAVAQIYEHIIDGEEKGNTSIGWLRNIYPTKNTALKAVQNKDLFVLEDDGNIVASMRLNQEQVDEYKNCTWEYPAKDEEIMVMHTLAVEPSVAGKGYGRKMLSFYEKYAITNDCPFLRIDTNVTNTRARKMYQHYGYKEIGITPCVFNGIAGVELVCLEKKLS